jgi:predicted transcriptional regulator
VVVLVKVKSVIKIEKEAVDVLRETLSRANVVKIESIRQNVPFSAVKNSGNSRVDIDIVVKLRSSSSRESQVLIAEVKKDGQPRYANQAVNQLLRFKSEYPDAYFIFMAPFISRTSAEICKSEGIGYIDFSGNCYISTKNIFIERMNYPSLFQEKRELRSIFTPKASRVLRVLLNDPGKTWKIQDIAKEANISIGLASNLKKKLSEQEFIEEKDGGIILSTPDKLLNKWAENYSYRKNEIKLFYSMNSIPEIEAEVAGACSQAGIKYALTGFSGADRLAPFVRYQQAMIYIESSRAYEILEKLNLKQTERGANLGLWIPYDEFFFYGAKNIDGINVAMPEQIYLDLKNYPGRGAEASEAILEEVIKTKW